MDNQESKSNWDELARELGAEIRPEEPTPTPPAANESYATERSRDKPRSAPPKRQAADWSQLNVKLGLPPVEEPPAPSTQPASPMPVPAPPAREKRFHEERTLEETPPEGRHSREREEGRYDREERPRRRGGDRGEVRQESDEHERPRGDQSRERSRGNRGGRRRERDDRGGPPRREHRDRDQSERDESERRGQGRGRGSRERDNRGGERESRPSEDRDNRRSFPDAEQEHEISPRVEQLRQEEGQSSQAPPTPPQTESPPKSSAGVSLWHKIFGAPAEPAEKVIQDDIVSGSTFESEEVVVESEHSWPRGDSDLDVIAPPDAEPIETKGDADAVGDSDETDPSEGSRRRPRRRRRGRGGKGADTRGGEEQISRGGARVSAVDSRQGHEDDFDDLGVENGLDDEFAAGSAQEEDFKDEDLSDDSDEREPNGRTSEGRASRRIPSWNEAIGMIVESNLQTRSQRAPSSHSRGGIRGGRGRGGRRRHRPSNG